MRQPPSAAVFVKKRMASRTSSTTISLRSLSVLGLIERRTALRPGWEPAAIRRAAMSSGLTSGKRSGPAMPGSAGSAALSIAPDRMARAKRKASVALPMPSLPVSSQPCASLPLLQAFDRIASAAPWPIMLKVHSGPDGAPSSFESSIGEQPFFDGRSDLSGNVIDRPGRVDDDAAVRLAAGDIEEGVAHRFVERQRTILEAGFRPR